MIFKHLAHRWSLIKNVFKLEEQTVNLKNQIMTLESQLQDCDRTSARQKKQLDELRLVVADSQQIGEQNILLTLYTELAEPLAGLVHLSHQYSQTKLSLTGDVISNIHQVIQVLEKHGMISQGQPGQITVFDSDIHSPIFASDTPAPGDSVIIEFPGMAFHDQIILKAKVKKVVKRS